MWQDRLQQPDFRHRRQVRWIDVDASRTVHFASYFLFMEEAEYQFLRSRGYNVVIRDERGLIGFPRIGSRLEIVSPAVFDEWLTVWLKLSANDGVQLEYQLEITGGDQRLVARGGFGVACCRFNPGELPRAILLPDYLMRALPESRVG